MPVYADNFKLIEYKFRHDRHHPMIIHIKKKSFIKILWDIFILHAARILTMREDMYFEQ